ncbi:hypothetical protein SHIRM173S_04871 [Streptomyces hirsutus]
MSFWPRAASHRLVVPPGTSAHRRPSDRLVVTPAEAHQGSVVVSKVPLRTCSTSSAPAGAAGSAVSAVASRPVRDSSAVLRLFTSGLLWWEDTAATRWERSHPYRDIVVADVTLRQQAGRDW